MHKDFLLTILDHFVELESSLEQLLEHSVIPVAYRRVDNFGNAMVAIELLQLTLVDTARDLLFRRLNI